MKAEPATRAAGVPWPASLRTRLMLWVGALVALLLLAGFATAFYATRSRIVADAQVRTLADARQAADRLDAAMTSVRISGESLTGLARKAGLSRDGLRASLEAVLDANPSTVGGLIALEPGVLADGAPMANYVGVATRGVPSRDLVATGYRYRQQPWYQRTLAATAPWWSEPYFNETAGGRYMATLNLPLRDVAGRAIGMVSLDVPVQALAASLETLRAVPGQQLALYAPEGEIAVHPEPGVAFQTTLAQYIERRARPDLQPLEDARKWHRAMQFTHSPRGGEVLYSVLQPVGGSGWSLQLSLAQGAMLANLRTAMRLLVLVGLVVALATAFAVLRLSRQITVPLRELATSAGHFANGEFDWPVPHDARGDEVGVMARALERARDSIRQQLDEISRYAAERQKLESELQIARDIQLSMLPHDGMFAAGRMQYALRARLEPAKAVGGDFHAHFRQGADRVWFVVGDVSDKGVPAALFMARAVTVLEVAAAASESPGEVLVDAARHLCEGNDACMFATVLCGSLELSSGALTLASAGHDAPLLRRADGHVEAIALESGPALGFDAVEAFELWHGRLQPGDVLFAWTDGVTEAFDPADEAFGETRLRETLRAARDAGAACDGMLRAVHEFAAGAAQSDDITVFAIDCAPAPAASDWRQDMRVPLDRERLPGVLVSLASHLQAAGVDAARIHDAELIAEELLCNAMDHGAQAGCDALAFAASADGGAVTLELRDNGAAYDPLSQPPPDLDADIADRPIGGLGIHLVRELAQDVRYRRENGRNVLRIGLGAILPPP